MLKTDGTVQCFGDPNNGGNCSSLNLTDVVSVTGNYRAFAAIHSDGRVTTWGPYENGGDSSEVSQELAAGVVTITGCRDNFVAIKGDGSAVSWPRNMTDPGTSYTSVSNRLDSGIATVVGVSGAVAVLKEDGSVVTFGSARYGGNSSIVESELHNITTIIGASKGFWPCVQTERS